MSNSIKKAPSACSLGDVIKFKLISEYDTTVYSGKIQAIADYERARAYGDIAAMHRAKLSGASLINKEMIDCRLDKYFIVKCHDDEVRPIGFQWIHDDLVEVLSEDTTFDIRLFNISSEKAAQAIAILRRYDFVCKLIPK
jgi:hypothetical protein